MRFRLYIVLIIFVLATSCSEYEKLLKSPDYDLKRAKAKEYFDEGSYVKSSELLKQILPRFRATEMAEDLNWMNAMCYYKMKDYLLAGSYLRSFIDQYPFGTHAEEANFTAAMCDYNMSPRPELDQTTTRNAIDGFKVFIIKYPGSSKIEESKKLINELQEKLVEKSYLSARLYYDMKQYKAAIVALNNSLNEYITSKYREEMMYLKLNSLFLYAENSLVTKQKERYQNTMDDYYSFMEEFPESNYSKEADNIFQKTNKFLNAGATAGEVNMQ